ncbi:alpha-2 adrenergic receptor [Trichonephila clavipes]|nr:alpha-2 adrenergic receptor [Trichonephila clavipes]
MKIGNNGNLVLGPFDESTPCLMIVLMNCQTKLRIYHLTAVKSVAILEILTYTSETWPLTLRDEEALGIFMRKTLRCILGGIQVNGSWRRRFNLELYKIYKQPDISSEYDICEGRRQHTVLFGVFQQTLSTPRSLDGGGFFLTPRTQSGSWAETATAGWDVVQSGRPIFDDFFQHLWPYIGNNTANVVFQMVKRLWLIHIDQ